MSATIAATGAPKHVHHIQPRYLIGEDNSPDNLTPPISIQLHAALHKDLYEHLGNTQDFLAWKMLAGQSLKGIIFTPEVRKKMSDSHKGKPSGMLGKHPPSGTNIGNTNGVGNTNKLGKKHSEETKHKQSVSATKRYQDPEQRLQASEIGKKREAVRRQKRLYAKAV